MRKWMIGTALVVGCMGLSQAFPGPRSPQTLVKLADKNPGLVPGLARHLLEDVGEEGLQALLDVHTDLRAHYPQFDHELAGLLQEGRQRRQEFRGRYPRLRSWFLGRLESRSEQPPSPRAYLAQHHPKLLLGLALSASRLIDEKYPELPAHWREQRGKQGFAPFLLENAPDGFAQFVHSLSPEQRQEVRAALLGYLKEREAWAQRQPADRFARGYQDLVTQFPGIAESWAEVREQSYQARQQRFPGLRQVVLSSLNTRHPGLIEKARKSVEKHYPGLVN